MVPRGLELLQSFDTRIRPYVECLLTQQTISMGLTNEHIQIVDPKSGCLPKSLNEAGKFDRFKVKIPYAHQTLTWEVIFDASNLKEPPDFIFDQEDDDFYPPLEEINSLVCWDWQNRESLTAVVADILEHYKNYQLERAGSNNVLQRHMRSLLAERPEGLQIVVNRGERALGTVNVLMNIEMDFSNLPAYLAQDNPGKDAVVLHVCFPYPESTSIQSQMFLSPRVESALGGSSCLQIPVFQQGILLGEYYSSIKQLLKKQVKMVADGYERRKDYIAAFLSRFGKSVLEYDVLMFSKIVLLLEWNDFFFTFTAELPLYFPTEHPVFIFKSVYHSQGKKPYTEKFTDFPYSPRWSGNEMAKRASAFILDAIRDFQKASVTNSDR